MDILKTAKKIMNTKKSTQINKVCNAYRDLLKSKREENKELKKRLDVILEMTQTNTYGNPADRLSRIGEEARYEQTK